MADIDGGRVELFDNITDRGKHLDLGGDVKRRGRLIKNDQVGTAGERHRGHRALELATRHLMRVAQPELIRIWQIHPLIKAGCVGFSLRPGHHVMLQRCLAELVDQTMRRIEAGSRRLGDIGNAAAAKLAQLLSGLAEQVKPVKFDRAIGDLAAIPAKPHRGKAKGRFASPGLTDQAKHLAPVEIKIDTIDDIDPGLVTQPLDMDIAHGQERRGGAGGGGFG